MNKSNLALGIEVYSRLCRPASSTGHFTGRQVLQASRSVWDPRDVTRTAPLMADNFEASSPCSSSASSLLENACMAASESHGSRLLFRRAPKTTVSRLQTPGARPRPKQLGRSVHCALRPFVLQEIRRYQCSSGPKGDSSSREYRAYSTVFLLGRTIGRSLTYRDFENSREARRPPIVPGRD
jgi:hypothetical protein